jgi:hypothetical protein
VSDEAPNSPASVLVVSLSQQDKVEIAKLVVDLMRANPPTPEYLTINEAAIELNRDPRTIQNYIAKDLLHSTRALHRGSSRVMVPWAEVQALRDKRGAR